MTDKLLSLGDIDPVPNLLRSPSEMDPPIVAHIPEDTDVLWDGKKQVPETVETRLISLELEARKQDAETNKLIEETERMFLRLKLDVGGMVSMPGGKNYLSFERFSASSSEKPYFRLVTLVMSDSASTDPEEMGKRLLVDCSMRVRTLAAGVLPKLLEKIVENAEKRVTDMMAAVDKLHEFNEYLASLAPPDLPKPPKQAKQKPKEPEVYRQRLRRRT